METFYPEWKHSDTGLPELSWKIAIKRVVAVVVIAVQHR